MTKPVISVITVAMIKRDPEAFAVTAASMRDQIAAAPPGTIEWIIQNGEDPSAESAQAFADVADIATHAESVRDGGIYPGMDKGMDKASADMLLFLNSGDRPAEAGTLAMAVRVLQEFPEIDFLYGDFEFGDRHFKAFGMDTATNDMPTSHQAMFIRNKGQRHDPRFKLLADYKMYTDMKPDIAEPCYLPVTLAHVEPNGVSARQRGRVSREALQIRLESGVSPLKSLNRYRQDMSVANLFSDAVQALQKSVRPEFYAFARDTYRKLKPGA